MSPALLLTLLVAAVLALIPVWRLARAGWSRGWLTVTWLSLAAGLVLVLRAPPVGRVLVPLLVLAFVAPFVTSPERLTRLFRREPRGVVIDVTPRLGLRPGGKPEADATTDDDNHDDPGEDGRRPPPAS